MALCAVLNLSLTRALSASTPLEGPVLSSGPVPWGTEGSRGWITPFYCPPRVEDGDKARTRVVVAAGQGVEELFAPSATRGA